MKQLPQMLHGGRQLGQLRGPAPHEDLLPDINFTLSDEFNLRGKILLVFSSDSPPGSLNDFY